jgi:hypothetical protein
MRKYRVKTTTFKSGRKEYRAQVKGFWGWYDINFEGEAWFSPPCATDKYDRALGRIDLHKSQNTVKDEDTYEMRS